MGVTLDHAAGVAGTSMKKLTSTEMAEHRDHVHAEARERISGIGGALRLSLNNMTVGSLREYIALSRHQLEMSEYVNIHTGGSDDTDDLWIQKIDWPTGQYHPFRMARRPVDESEQALPAAWAVEQLRDVMWRVRAVSGLLGRSGNRLVATDADGITELSNHQSEIADFLRTGRFKKVPRRRKARYLGGDDTQSAETAERVRELGAALKEYQGRIEIKTVREFIALSKHQCELAGMVIASEREMKGNQTIELVHYGEAYGLKGEGNNANAIYSPAPPQAGSCSDLIGASRCFLRSKTTTLDSPVRPGNDDKSNNNNGKGICLSAPVENRPSPARTRGESVSPGVPFCDTFGHAKVSEENHMQSIEGSGTAMYGQGCPDREISGSDYKPGRAGELFPGHDVLHGHIIERYSDGGALVRAVLPGGTREFRIPEGFVPPGGGPVPLYLKREQAPPEPYWHDDVWEDDYWAEDWDDDP